MNAAKNIIFLSSVPILFDKIVPYSYSRLLFAGEATDHQFFGNLLGARYDPNIMSIYIYIGINHDKFNFTGF